MHPRYLCLGVWFAVLSAPVAAIAQTAQVISIATAVSGSVSGVPLAASQGPASTGALLAVQNWSSQSFSDPAIPARAEGAQDVGGLSAVRVEALPDDPQDDFQNAESRWSDTVTHTGQFAAEYVYEFHIDPAVLALRNTCEDDDITTGPVDDCDDDVFTGGASIPDASASYEITVKLEGQTVFHSAATLRGTASNPRLTETGTDLGGTFFKIHSKGIYGYRFNAFDGVLPLGSYDQGGTFHVEAILNVSSLNDEPGMGTRALIGDPLKLGGEPGIAGRVVITTTVGAESLPWAQVKVLYRAP
jgi:hypothetical protein